MDQRQVGGRPAWHDQRSKQVAVRLGIIGTGAVARWHIRNYLATPGASVVAVCDIAPERAAAVAAEFGIPTIETSAEALAARPDVDAVSVCTPNDSHAAATLAALRAGKHVLCEKPLALTLADARAMLLAAEAAGVHHMVHFSKRPFPGIIQLAALIGAGDLGDILHVEASYHQSWLVTAPAGGDASRRVWRLDPRVAGTGVLGDLGSHLIDLGHHLVGSIRQVNGLLETKARQSPLPEAISADAIAIDDSACFMARFEAGATGVFTATRIAAGTRDDIRLEVYGSRGAARFSNRQPDRLHLCLGETSMKHFLWSEMACAPQPDQPASVMTAFARAIATGQVTPPTFADGVRCQAVMAAIEEAARAGGWVAVETAAQVEASGLALSSN